MPEDDSLTDSSFDSDEESSEETTSTESSEDSSGSEINQQQAGSSPSGNERDVYNMPHDYASAVDTNNVHRVHTPPEMKGMKSPNQVPVSPSMKPQEVHNEHHDEAYEVPQNLSTLNEGAYQQEQYAGAAGGAQSPGGHEVHNEQYDYAAEVAVPQGGHGQEQRGPPMGGPGGIQSAAAFQGHEVSNEQYDFAQAVAGGSMVRTPPGGASRQQQQQQQQQQQPGQQQHPSALGADDSVVRDMPHDEEWEADPTTTQPQKSPQAADAHAHQQVRQQPQKISPMKHSPQKQPKSSMRHEDDDDSDSSESSEDNAPVGNVPNPGGANYDPAAYADLKVSREVKDLFAIITAFQPQNVECPTKLRPFVPELIPAVGDIDTFCKVPRPDGKPDNLGLAVVDEPCANQTTGSVVRLIVSGWLRRKVPPMPVESVEDAANRPQFIDKWLGELKAGQATKPLQSVTYSKPMPEIEKLLQVWPPEFEELLNSDLQLPSPDIDVDLVQYIKMLCAILDIPVYNNIVESLHVLFTLYLEFRDNQHFQTT